MMSPLESNNGGQILQSISHSQLETTKKTIMDFKTELLTSHYQNPPDSPLSSPIAFLVCFFCIHSSFKYLHLQSHPPLAVVTDVTYCIS